MAVPRKQRRVAPQESSDSENNSDNENNEEIDEIVQVDFDVSSPESSDTQGIKNLLQQLFLKAHINTSELADILIEQNDITGVIKETEDSEDVDMEDDDMNVTFGVFSIINLTAKKNKECVKQIHSYLLQHCQEASSQSDYEMFKKILEDDSKHVGLIISERFINIPGKISVPLYTGLGNDMSKAKEKKLAYDFEYFVLICKTSTFTEVNSHVYLNPEEELLAEEAEFSFEFQVQAEQDSGLGGQWDDDDSEGIPKRKVLLIPATKLDIMCNKLADEFGRDFQPFSN